MAVNWVESQRIFTNSYGPDNPLVLFWSTVVPTNQWIPGGFALSASPTNPTWNTIDLTSFGVDSQATWAVIGGIYIITGAGEIRQLPRGINSSDSFANYDQQLLSWSAQGGERQVGEDWVPLSNGQFQLAAIALPYPNPGGANPQCAVNFKLKAWG